MNKSNELKMGILVFLCLLWGTTWIAIKYTLEGIPPFLGAMFRFVVAVMFLYLYARMKGLPLKVEKQYFKYIFISAILLYLFDYGLIYWGEQYLYAGVTAVFFATFPLFTGLVSNFVYKNESFEWSKFVGLVLAFGGITLIFYDQLLVTEFSGLVFWASAAIILSALSAAFSLVMVKKYLSEVPTVALTLHQMLWGVFILGIIGLLGGEAANIHLTTRVVLSVFYLGAIGSALAFVLFYSLLKEMSAITLSSIIYVTPLVAIFVGWILLNETITLRIIAGTFIIFSGIAVSQLKEYKKASRNRRSETIPEEEKLRIHQR
jgi:drug/metabolite transporter (DMT)-like permease